MNGHEPAPRRAVITTTIPLIAAMGRRYQRSQRHHVDMEHRVDLDVLAGRLEPMLAKWSKTARVGQLTWRDEQAEWPQPITSDRSCVAVPESLGLRITSGADEIEVCVWTGGWADIDWVDDGEGQGLCPEFTDVDGAYAAVVQNVEDLLA